MILLQTQYDFFGNSNSPASYVGLAIFGGLVAVAIFVSLLGNRRNRKPGTRASNRHVSIKRQAKRAGLSPEQIRTLEHMIKSQKLHSPLKLLDGGQYLTSAIREELEVIEAEQVSDGVKEARKNTLFQIKATLDSGRANLNTLSSSRNIRIGQDVKIVFEHGGGSFETSVISNLENMLGVEVPESTDGPIRPEKGVRAQITFIRDNNRVYRFVTRVRGLNTVRGRGTLFVDHVNDIMQVQKRKSPRKELGKPAYYYLVQIVENGSGRKLTRQAVVQKNQNYLGRIEDISTGGCLIRAQRPLKKGSLIRVDFQSETGKSISAFGKVCGVDSRAPYGGDMHVMFTRVSQNYMNEIMAYVYGFVE